MVSIFQNGPVLLKETEQKFRELEPKEVSFGTLKPCKRQASGLNVFDK